MIQRQVSAISQRLGQVGAGPALRKQAYIGWHATASAGVYSELKAGHLGTGKSQLKSGKRLFCIVDRSEQVAECHNILIVKLNLAFEWNLVERVDGRLQIIDYGRHSADQTGGVYKDSGEQLLVVLIHYQCVYGCDRVIVPRRLFKLDVAIGAIAGGQLDLESRARQRCCTLDDFVVSQRGMGHGFLSRALLPGTARVVPISD